MGSHYKLSKTRRLTGLSVIRKQDSAPVRMGNSREKTTQSSLHIFALIFLQIIIVILFSLFVRYDPKTAMRSDHSVEKGAGQIRDTYPMFQDVHVMIFLGFDLPEEVWLVCCLSQPHVLCLGHRDFH